MKKLGEFLMSKWGMPIFAILIIVFSPIILPGLIILAQVEWYLMTPEERENARKEAAEAEWDDGYTP